MCNPLFFNTAWIRSGIKIHSFFQYSGAISLIQTSLTFRRAQCYLSRVWVQCAYQAHVKNVIIKIEFKRLRLHNIKILL